MWIRTLSITLGAVSSLVVTAATGVTQPAGAVVAHRGCDTGAMDFDGNGGTDLAIGAPGYGEGSHGRVVVLMKAPGGPHKVVVRAPERFAKGNRYFGRSVGDVDLSRHTDSSEPCSDLVVGSKGAVYLFRWSRTKDDFVFMHRIVSGQVKPPTMKVSGFGTTVATQTEPGNRPAPRKPLLYISAPWHASGVVFRVKLTHRGKVKSSSMIRPAKPHHESSRMPMTRDMAYHFGITVQGTPSPNEVIIGDPRAYGRKGLGEDRGAVVVWRRSGGSQLLNERTLLGAQHGHPNLRPVDLADFGISTYLSTSVAVQAGVRPSLYIGADGGGHDGSGAVYQLPFHHDGRVGIGDAKIWTTRSTGVSGRHHQHIGAHLEGFVGNGGRPRVVTSGDGGNGDRVVVLGTGQAFTSRSFGLDERRYIGGLIGDWQDRPDHLAKDPWKGVGAGSTLKRVAFGGAARVVLGLRSSAIRVVHARHCGQDYCDFGRSLTASTGGGTNTYEFG